MTHFDETSRWMRWSKNEFSHSLSLQATRDGRFRRRCAMARQASSAFADLRFRPALPDLTLGIVQFYEHT